MKRILFLLSGILVVLAGCSSVQLPKETTFSFENGLEGWTAQGTDLSNPTDNWSIELSQDRAIEGKTSVKMYLDNVNDMGKIWIQRPFSVDSNSYYQCTIQYEFATADYGSFNLWTIITGALLGPPTRADELVYQLDTGNGADEDAGYRRLSKEYTFDLRTGPEKEIYVVIGVWGTWETARTYYIDNVKIILIKG